MPNVSFGSFAKRKNSTKQPSGLGDTRNVKLKDGTSVDNPTFILTGNDFNFNYAKWDDRYYFVNNIVSLHNNLTEVSCELDVLATYKSEILGSTQYVCYSNVSGGQWLQDNRLPVMKNALTAVNTANLDFPSTQGSYILTVLGKSGVDCFRVTRSTIQSLITELQNWNQDVLNDIKIGLAYGTEEERYESLANAMLDSGFLGNEYEVAVQCIRSCHWVPFDGTVIGGTPTQIYLGNYPCRAADASALMGDRLSLTWHSGSVGIAIPWHYNDWRRTYCEKVYLYLPFVGMVSLNSDDINGVNGLVIKYSITPSDGQVCYEVSAGGQVIGTYGGNCAMQIPIGINQKASLGDIVTTLFAGAEKTVNMAINSSISPVSASAVGVGAVMAGVETAYNTANVALSTTPSTIGGIGGGAGAGLDLQAKCITVAHPTVIEPMQMLPTMGVPTMKPMQLSNCGGYCKCANAHVECAAQSGELNVLDAYLNSGFYIE